jgi:3-deoxy-D-manno-octulosonate 8-phosphate phosphatase (KDO 8-P phosphatase)
MDRVKLIVLDVDGTLTDGVVDIDDEGNERKKFHIHDGLGIVMAQCVGLRIAIVTARRSRATEHRMGRLGVTDILQDVPNKAHALLGLMARDGLEPAEIAFVGDDLTDLPAFDVAGVRIAVADAAAVVRKRADWVTPRPGGHGAVRDAIDEILRRQGRLDEAVAAYLGRQTERRATARQ